MDFIQELIGEIEETGWSGGGQNPANLTRREVQVFPNFLLKWDCQTIFCFISHYYLYNVYSLFQMMLDTKDKEQDETEKDESRKSVADCLEHIQVILRLTAVSEEIYGK